MLRFVPLSIIAHATVLGLSYVTVPGFFGPQEYSSSELVAVSIEMVELGEITNIAPTPKPEKTPEPEPEEPTPEPEPETPEPETEDDAPVDESVPEGDEDVTNPDTAAAPEPSIEDLLPDFDANEADEKSEEVADETPKETAPTRSPEDEMNDLFNDIDSTFKSQYETRKKKPAPKPKKKLTDASKPKPAKVKKQGAGERTANIARLESLMYSRVKECWRGVDDQPNPEKLNVRLKVKLNKNGTIDDLKVLEPTQFFTGRHPSAVAIQRAKTAVRTCAPYNLPEDDYDLWSDVNVNLGKAFADD